MGYVAGKALQIQSADGSIKTLKPGDPVPEAATWKRLDGWIKQGRILLVPDTKNEVVSTSLVEDGTSGTSTSEEAIPVKKARKKRA